MYVLTEFQLFGPNRIAFDNMVSSANIDLISNNDLRNKLSKYYKKDFSASTQERIKELTRKFTDYATEVMFNKQLVKMVTNFESQITDVSKINMHSDEKLYGLLFGMRINIAGQNDLLEDTKQEIMSLMELIDHNLKKYE